MTAVNIDRLLIRAAIVLLLAVPIGARAASVDAANAGAAPAASDNSSTATDSATAPASATSLPEPSAKPDAPAAAGPADTGTAVAAPMPANTVPAAAAANADPDAVIVQQLHGLASGKFDTVLGNADVRATVDAFYSGRNYAPIWLTAGSPNARAQAAIDYLRHVDADGLNPADYPIPDFAGATDPASQ
ncbi:MAG: murein L,D-transpeptidase, partial [Xanthobacteraceae bacterium]